MKTDFLTSRSKTIKMSLDQYAVNRTAITWYITELERKEVFWLDKLNASSSQNEVRNNQYFLATCRKQIKDLKKLVKSMDETELVTTHKLY